MVAQAVQGGTMPEDSLGAGPALDELLDFSVGRAGDLEIFVGREELEKDLAVLMIISLQEFLGEPPDMNTKAGIRRKSRLVVEQDPRIVSVDTENIVVEIEDREQINVSVPCTTTFDDEYELVFEV